MLSVSGTRWRRVANVAFALTFAIATPGTPYGMDLNTWGPEWTPIPRPVKTTPCTCEDLQRRLDEVIEQEQVYEDLAKERKRFDNYDQLRDEIGRRLGQNLVVIGKGGGAATGQEIENAKSECRAKGYCTWICDVSLMGVHEKFHDWYDLKGTPWWHLVSRTIGDFAETYTQWSGGNPMLFLPPRRESRPPPNRPNLIRDKIYSEIGAHTLEKNFLRDVIEEAHRNNECKGIQASPSKEELDARFDAAKARIEDFLRTNKL